MSYSFRKISLITLLVFGIYTTSYTCECSLLPPISKGEVDTTAYIALVRVKEILPVPNIAEIVGETPFFYYKIIIEEITLYKGKGLKEIIVGGGNPKFNRITSCDLGIDENDEWLIFLNYYNGYPMLGPCGRSKQYREYDGLRKWGNQVFSELAWLDDFYNKSPVINTIRKGKKTTYFPNGKIEKIENFRKGKLNGLIEYFYPNGNIYGQEQYQKGKLNKKQIWYRPEGNIISISNYTNGIKTDSSFSFWDCFDSTNRLHFIKIYSKKGNLKKTVEYSDCSKDEYRIKEDNYDLKSGILTTSRYYETGELRLKGQYLRGVGVGIHIEYDKQGNITNQWEYDTGGKIIKKQ